MYWNLTSKEVEAREVNRVLFSSLSLSPLALARMTAAPDVPARIEIEQSLEHLLQSLLELGICASDVQESALESSSHGIASQQPGGLIGRKAQVSLPSLSLPTTRL